MNSTSKIFIYPTDTVWGIGSNIYDEDAHHEIARIKKSAEDKPLSIMFTDLTELMRSFCLPEQMDEKWLRAFFQMESTLGLPLSSARILIPSWVHGGSDMVSIRFLEAADLREIRPPFFTTSLNLTGRPPITNYQEASEFRAKYAPQAQLLGSPAHNLSGQASTIIFFKDRTFRFIRHGRMSAELRKHLELTGFSCS